VSRILAAMTEFVVETQNTIMYIVLHCISLKTANRTVKPIEMFAFVMQHSKPQYELESPHRRSYLSAQLTAQRNQQIGLAKICNVNDIIIM